MKKIHEPGIAKSIAEVMRQSYVIPLYQRNYNWGAREIRQFLQDIYESFGSDPNRNYYIGSLVVFKRKADEENYEVIDGQQRLTTIHLIAGLIHDNYGDFMPLRYDSRKEVEDFFIRFIHEKESLRQQVTDLEHGNLSSFFAAVDTLLHEKLESEFDSELTISGLKGKGKIGDFASYFFNKVMLVEVEMPSDTDVANYFEIMNNRGRQLQEHEILKAQLMSQIDGPKNRSIFGNVWDACSQMERPLHKFFNTEDRHLLFGENYDNINSKKIYKLQYDKAQEGKYSALDILDDKAKKTRISSQGEIEDELDEDIEYTPVIDFTNFLIHILKLTYTEADIPLSSDKLLKIYKSIPREEVAKVPPMVFLEKLFFYRVIFDRFIVKSEAGSENSDLYEGVENNISNDSVKARWMLVKPVMYLKNTRYKSRRYPSLNFKNTFENKDCQDRAVKLLSMLQVTYRQQKNKNYLQFILGLFKPNEAKCIDIEPNDFLRKIETFTLDQFDKLEFDNFLEIEDGNAVDEGKIYAQGTRTPHFIFNFIDYLLWVDTKYNGANYEIDQEFDFTYRNSIEHHYPQALKNHIETKMILDTEITLNCLGNLCLVSRGANSKLNDREPLGKAADQRFNLGSLTPKRRMMYKSTNNKGRWNEKEILAHHLVIINVLRRRKEILGIEK